MVSVILPVFNAAGTLPRAVESVLEQSLRELELIIVDDGSTDDSAEVAAGFSTADSRVRVICFEGNRGVAHAAEAGRLAASSGFIARMDADDVCHPDRLRLQLEFLQSNPHIAGCGTAVELIGAPPADPGRGFAEHVRWLNGLNSSAQLAAERFIDSPIANPTSMVRAEALQAVGGHQDPAWAEDYDLWLRLLNAGHALCNLPEPLLKWRDSARRLTRSDERYSAEMFSKAKAHYLAKLSVVREQGVAVAGAGPIGKRLARDLMADGVAVRCFYEVNPRRIGENIAGIEVRDYSVCSPSDGVMLGAVGLPGARERVRALAKDAGYVEGADFFCVA